MPRLPFLIDENVADSVAKVLADLGHDVTLVRDSLGRKSPDQLLAIVADQFGLIVVTHDKDLRRFSRLLPEGARGLFRQGAGVIHLACPEDIAASRLRELIDVIEFHYERARRSGARLIMRITKTNFSVNDPQPSGEPAEDRSAGESEEPSSHSG